MSKKSSKFTLEEMPGSQFSDLQTTQRAAVKALAPHLAGTLRDLLARGWLVNVDGQIIPNPERRL